ncbi:hypothetical protein [Paraburkholderia sp. J67]|uniref:hypothetical protein n=1 Tax=Paraburkholderia sp. J67 TaxID=2805435 RepID=UPI002ABE28E2|nr:hypothetical protein [Paraburkholderia sp. J67]
MSMNLSVAKFETREGKLNSDYSNLSKEVIVTDFLDSLISEKFVSSFQAFEDDEGLEYREISTTHIIELSEKVDHIEDKLLSDLENASGKSKREELISNIRDITLLNMLIKIFLINDGMTDSRNIKLLIS